MRERGKGASLQAAVPGWAGKVQVAGDLSGGLGCNK